jgi:hypothetical protein
MDIDLDFATIKPSIGNLLMIFLMVCIVVPVGKWFFSEVIQVPGFTPLVQSL